MTRVTRRSELIVDKRNFRWICFSVGVLCLAASSRTVAQDEVPRVEWEKTFGGAADDVALSVQQTTDGGYIVAGRTESFGAGETDVYLIKLDAQANRQWQRTFGGVNYDKAWSVQQTADGGYIVAGSTSSFGAGGGDVYLIKLDAQGFLDPAWPENPRTYGGEASDFALSVQQTADGGYIVAGGTWSVGGVGRRGTTERDVYLIKLDAQGDFDPAWPENPRIFGGAENDVGWSVQQTADGGYIVAGRTGIDSFGAGDRDVYLIKLDAEGFLDPAWPENPRIFGGANDDWAVSVQQTADGGYIVAGGTRSFGAAVSSVYLIKLDAEGFLDPAWSQNPRSFGGEASDWANSVQQTADGGYIVAGARSFGAGVVDVYLIKLAPVPAASAFRRGDVDDDGKVQLTDAVRILDFLFAGAGEPACLETADADDSGAIQLTDAVRILTFLFAGGPELPPPGPKACGTDPVDSPHLDCASYRNC